MEQKIRIIGFCSYIGKNYCGFQRQIQNGKEIKTVQLDLESILTHVFKQEIKIRSCSRTDAGVSAMNLAFQFYVSEVKAELKVLRKRLNWQFKAQDINISIENLQFCSEDLDIRGSVLYKTYVYSIDANLGDRTLNAYQRQKLVWSLEEKIDLQKFQEVLELYVGVHNFLSFTILEKRYKNLDQYKKEIISCKIIQKQHEIYEDVQSFQIEIIGKTFMTYQVRYMVGMAYMYQKNKISIEKLQQLMKPTSIDFSQFNDKTRIKAPSWGLCLQKVIYDQSKLFDFIQI